MSTIVDIRGLKFKTQFRFIVYVTRVSFLSPTKHFRVRFSRSSNGNRGFFPPEVKAEHEAVCLLPSESCLKHVGFFRPHYTLHGTAPP